ncbi:leucine-rich repeat domain-containing protein [Cryptosporangium arvum]|nr:leucine-rich repeat domain-containing protein [Cryptosporangium arvum]
MSGTLKIDWRDGEHGIWVVPREPWTPAHTQRFIELGAAGLSLGAAGWRAATHETSVAFLRDLVGLRHLLVMPMEGEHDWSVLGELPHLETLWLDIPGLKPIPDLERLTAIRRLILEWHPGQEQLLMSIPPLAELGIVRWGLADLTALTTHLTTLQQLHLTSARRITSLGDLEPATTLESLRLTYCTRLNTLEPLSQLTGLRRLAIDRCGKLSDFSALGTLRNLRALELANTTIDDLDALRGLPDLEYLSIDGNVRSGDLSPLLALPALRILFFQNRKHYSHRVTEIQEALGLDPAAYPEPGLRSEEIK